MKDNLKQSELKKIQFAPKIEACKYFRQESIRVSHREFCKTGNHIRSHCEELQELHVSADESYLEHSYNLFSS